MYKFLLDKGGPTTISITAMTHSTRVLVNIITHLSSNLKYTKK